MNTSRLLAASAAAILALTCTAAFAQDRENRQGHTQFDDHDQQVTRDWYKDNQSHRPTGLRDQDRLSSDQESRLHEGAVLDKDLRKRVHPAPPELEHRLPPAPSDHRYVVIGGHVGLIDKQYRVKGVIHLHDDQH